MQYHRQLKIRLSQAGVCTALFAASVLSTWGMLLSGGPSQNPHRDPAIPLDDSKENGYRDRGDRFEGSFRQPLSASIVVASFTKGPIRYELSNPESLRLSWDLKTPSDAFLRALSTSRMRPYSMTRFCAKGENGYVWAPDLLRAENIESQNLGITLRDVGAPANPPFLHPVSVIQPVRKSEGEAPPVTSSVDSYVVRLYPTVPLSSLTTTVTRSGKELFRNEAKRTYPAGIGIDISIALAKDVKSGEACEFAASGRADGSPCGATFKFIHQ